MDDFVSAWRYLKSPAGSFWRWGDDGDVVEWNSGGTIAFRAQIHHLLRGFADDRLPALELLILVLAACRDTWPEDRDRLVADESVDAWVRNRLMIDLLDGLDRIHQLPQQLRTSPDAVTALVEIIFDRNPGEEIAGEDVLELLSQAQWQKDCTPPDLAAVPNIERSRQFGWFREQAVIPGIDQLLNRMSTGLDHLPEPAEGDVSEEETAEPTVRQLLRDLRDDEEHAGLVRLVRMVSAVLTLPRSPSEPDELPQGGVSDIASRGSLDQLLLSELAHDDDTLVTRIALNEALYIRRETPPEDPIEQRCLLIDSGMRMWGLPRLFAAAVGLALAQEDRGRTVHVFRSDVDGITSVDFATRVGLTEHLAALDYRVHPGPDLGRWQQRMSSGLTHRVLITEDGVLADAAFRQEFQQSELMPCFVVAVNRQGRVRLLRQTAMGEKLLREVWLDADELSGAERTGSQSLIDSGIDPNLPAIIRLRRLPLRLPCDVSEKMSLAELPGGHDSKSDVLQLTRDRRLLLWDQPRAGGRQLSDCLPRGRIKWSGSLTGDGSVTIVLQGQQPPELHCVHVGADRETVTICRLNDPVTPTGEQGITRFAGHLGVLFVILDRSAAAIDPVTGRQLDVIEVPKSYEWNRDRYFRQGFQWHVLSYSAGSLTFEKLVILTETSSRMTLGIAGSPEHPLAVRSSGEVFDVVNRTSQQVVAAGKWNGGTLADVSGEGRRFVVTRPLTTVTGRRMTQVSVVDVLPGSLSEFPKLLVDERREKLQLEQQLFMFDPNLTVMPANRSLFKKPARLSYGRHLMIVTSKGRRLALDMRPQQPPGIVLRDVDDDDRPYRDTDAFSSLSAPSGVGYRLKQVQWGDGSRAVLDSRGMLHLQSGNPEIPEVTLILDESNVSGWVADSGIWGLDYYHDTTTGYRKIGPAQAMTVIERFVQNLPQ